MEQSTVTISPCVQDQSIRIIHLPARIDTISEKKVTEEVMAAFEGNPQGILFDLQEVKFVSSAGMRMFVHSSKKAKDEGIKIAMIHVPPLVYKSFKVAALDSLITICENEAQALKEVWLLQSRS